MKFIVLAIFIAFAALIDGQTDVVDLRVVDLKMKLNEFCANSKVKADTSFYTFLKNLNTTNTMYGRFIRDSTNLLNSTAVRFGATAKLDPTTKSDYLNMMEMIFNQCFVMNTDVIEKYSIPPFYAGAYQMNPAFVPIERLCVMAEQALNSLEQSLILNMKCATPFLTKLMPVLQPPVEKIMNIGTMAFINVTREFADSGTAVRNVVAYMSTINSQILKCQGSVKPTQNECIASYMSTTFATSNQLAVCYTPGATHTMIMDQVTNDYLQQIDHVNDMSDRITVFSDIMNCMITPSA
ncbi:unnamed protein product [Diamesa serratosioi]